MRTGEGRGWDAIDAALAPIVGRVEPQHWGNDAVRAGQLGLWGLSAYPLDGHWLFVTYGLTELFGKASGDPGISGWGEELTMRVARTEGEPVPRWPVRLLGQLGQLVFQRSAPFLPGGRMLVPRVRRRRCAGRSIRCSRPWRVRSGGSSSPPPPASRCRCSQR